MIATESSFLPPHSLFRPSNTSRERQKAVETSGFSSMTAMDTQLDYTSVLDLLLTNLREQLLQATVFESF